MPVLSLEWFVSFKQKRNSMKSFIRSKLNVKQSTGLWHRTRHKRRFWRCIQGRVTLVLIFFTVRHETKEIICRSWNHESIDDDSFNYHLLNSARATQSSVAISHSNHLVNWRLEKFYSMRLTRKHQLHNYIWHVAINASEVSCINS